MLLWLGEVGRARALHGTDIDPEAIAWCQEHIPYARCTVNDADPPLPYPDAAFDLVFNHSVFTHIDERRQDLWLSELQRVTKPGGFVVLSVHGEPALPDDAWEMRDELHQNGIVFLDRSVAKDFPLPDWYQNTWHAPWYVFEHWGRWFEIRAYVPGAALDFQDHVLLERGTEEGPARRPLAARPRVPVEGLPEHRTVSALAAARAYRTQPPVGRSFVSRARTLLRQAVFRAIRPYTAHEDRFDDAVVASIADLSRTADHQAAALKAIRERLDEHR